MRVDTDSVPTAIECRWTGPLSGSPLARQQRHYDMLLKHGLTAARVPDTWRRAPSTSGR